MIKLGKRYVMIVILSGLAVWYIYDEIFNWGEWGQVANYIIIALPVGISLLILSIKSSVPQNKFEESISVIGGILAIILLIPPYIIYRFFIK